jgi:phosphate starvation-inducible protein PhoH
MQSDINGKSGFAEICNIFDDEESKKNGIHVFYLTEEDIVRSELVKFIVKKLNLYNHNK